MRHRNRRGKLGRKSAHRTMMLRNMATSLFDAERIQTTLPKAKQLRPYAEKLITLAKRGDLHSRRLVLSQILKEDIVKKLFDDISKRYADGKGGYLRIVPYSARWGDGAQRAFVELTTAAVQEEKEKPGKGKKAKGKETKAKEAAPEKTEEKKTRKKKTTKEKEAEKE